MLAILRVVLVIFLSILICLIGTIVALVRFRHPSTVGMVARMFASLHPLIGLKLVTRWHSHYDKPAIYIANHQNNYDMLTVSAMVQPRTVSIGKKSLIWIPFFGLVYWLTGNVFIDRGNRNRAINTMTQVAAVIKNKQISIWMFPEGTRSRGRGLLPFKTGAFYAAINAGVPIIPVVCSNLDQKVKLNRWNNGYVICEVLDPIDTKDYNRDNLKALIEKCHYVMQTRISALNQEVAEWEK